MVAKQVFKSKHMIKHLQPNEIVETIAQRLGHFKYTMCTDYSKYDASQWASLLEIDAMLIRKICPEFSRYWDAAIIKPQLVRTKNGNIQFEDMRNWKSGEMNTSCGNTFLNMMIIEYTKHRMWLSEQATDYFTEGDDGIIGSDDLLFF